MSEKTKELLESVRKLQKENEKKLILETDIDIKVDELRKQNRYRNLDDSKLREIAKSIYEKENVGYK